MKNSMLLILLGLGFQTSLQASADHFEKKVVYGSFVKWEHHDYGLICSLTERESGDAVTITNCSAVPFDKCALGRFELIEVDPRYSLHEFVQGNCYT